MLVVDCPGVMVEQGRFHSLEVADEMGVILEAKVLKYQYFKLMIY